MSALKLVLIIIGSAFVLVVVAIIIMFLYAAMKIAAQEVIDRRRTDYSAVNEAENTDSAKSARLTDPENANG